MTRGIEDMLNLPHMDEVLKGTGINHLEDDDDGRTDEDLSAILESMDLMEAAGKKLAAIEGTDHAEEMDVINKETLKHSRDLMDLA